MEVVGARGEQLVRHTGRTAVEEAGAGLFFAGLAAGSAWFAAHPEALVTGGLVVVPVAVWVAGFWALAGIAGHDAIRGLSAAVAGALEWRRLRCDPERVRHAVEMDEALDAATRRVNEAAAMRREYRAERAGRLRPWSASDPGTGPEQDR